ncbi:unnamed protein product [Protopolystoma xenopodis]|uniref:Uncharacterized protein n=1 Tax=Protopolystoma xenopodis TaxID=117903 RepID=A0A3S5FCP9_9PLAT|nr:unnamed protein product [Protopolystoma xenopodis]
MPSRRSSQRTSHSAKANTSLSTRRLTTESRLRNAPDVRRNGQRAKIIQSGIVNGSGRFLALSRRSQSDHGIQAASLALNRTNTNNRAVTRTSSMSMRNSDTRLTRRRCFTTLRKKSSSRRIPSTHLTRLSLRQSPTPISPIGRRNSSLSLNCREKLPSVSRAKRCRVSKSTGREAERLAGSLPADHVMSRSAQATPAAKVTSITTASGKPRIVANISSTVHQALKHGSQRSRSLLFSANSSTKRPKQQSSRSSISGFPSLSQPRAWKKHQVLTSASFPKAQNPHQMSYFRSSSQPEEQELSTNNPLEPCLMSDIPSARDSANSVTKVLSTACSSNPKIDQTFSDICEQVGEPTMSQFTSYQDSYPYNQLPNVAQSGTPAVLTSVESQAQAGITEVSDVDTDLFHSSDINYNNNFKSDALTSFLSLALGSSDSENTDEDQEEEEIDAAFAS